MFTSLKNSNNLFDWASFIVSINLESCHSELPLTIYSLDSPGMRHNFSSFTNKPEGAKNLNSSVSPEILLEVTVLPMVTSVILKVGRTSHTTLPSKG